MVSVVLPSLSLSDASPLHVAVGALAATLVAYKLLASKPPHERYAAKHGLTNIKLAKRLPQTHFLLGDTMELSRNATRFVDWMYEKTVEMDEQPWLRHVPSLPNSIVVATPELIEDVTKTQNDIFGKGDITRTLFDDFVGSSFFTQDGAAWFHQRKLASKFFSARMFREVAMVKFAKHTETMLDVLEKACGTATQVNISHLLHEFTLQVISELAFGLEMDLIGSEKSHPLNDALEEAFPQILTRIQTPEWVWKLQKYLNIGGERKYRGITQEIRRIVSEMITKSVEQNLSRAGPRREPTTIVELFIHAMQDGEADWITPELLRDIGIMFVIGGRDTTAESLAWMLLMVGKHPEVEKKLRAELWRKVPELMEGKIKTLSMEQVHTLTYMEAIIKETLRFYPPVPLSQREAACDTHLVDGTFVPKGTTIGISTYTAGRLKSVWGDDVHEFKPERFIDEAADKPISHSAFKFASFSAGPRICIGMNLALLELKLVVATMFSRYRLEIAPNDGSYRFSASLPLKNPLMARIRPANPAAK